MSIYFHVYPVACQPLSQPTDSVPLPPRFGFNFSQSFASSSRHLRSRVFQTTLAGVSNSRVIISGHGCKLNFTLQARRCVPYLSHHKIIRTAIVMINVFLFTFRKTRGNCVLGVGINLELFFGHLKRGLSV